MKRDHADMKLGCFDGSDWKLHWHKIQYESVSCHSMLSHGVVILVVQLHPIQLAPANIFKPSWAKLSHPQLRKNSALYHEVSLPRTWSPGTASPQSFLSRNRIYLCVLWITAQWCAMGWRWPGIPGMVWTVPTFQVWPRRFLLHYFTNALIVVY